MRKFFPLVSVGMVAGALLLSGCNEGRVGAQERPEQRRQENRRDDYGATDRVGDSIKDAAKHPAETADNVATTAQVKSAFAMDKLVPATTINVDTVNDVVILRGTVESAQQKERATKIAMKVTGVKKVANHLQVRPQKK